MYKRQVSASAKVALRPRARALWTLGCALALGLSALVVLLECRRLAQAWGRGFNVRNPPEKLASLARLYGVGDLLFASAPAETDMSAT